MIAKPKMMLVEPIDYESLARAYVVAGWKFWDGYPTAKRLEESINIGRLDLSTRFGPNDCCCSGGIDIKRIDGQIVVLLDNRLAVNYQKPTNIPLGPTLTTKEHYA